MFYKQGDYAKAKQAFDRAAQVNPSAPEVNMNKDTAGYHGEQP